MGQFSYCCAVCDQEILHGNVQGYSKYKRAVALFPNGDRASGEYDGYGRIGFADINEAMYGEGAPKIVHECCLNGQSFEDLTKGDRHASDQGWWPGERQMVLRYGPPNMEEIEKEETYFCRLCLRTWKAKWSGGVCPWGCERPPYYGVSEEFRKEHPSWYPDGDSGSEIVEPFRYNHNGTPDGLAICRNERAEHKRWERLKDGEEPREGEKRDFRGEVYRTYRIDPCYRFGSIQQVRVGPVRSFEDCERGGEPKLVPVVPECGACGSTDIEILTLTPAELPKEE
jgi:hypothetical protein